MSDIGADVLAKWRVVPEDVAIYTYIYTLNNLFTLCLQHICNKRFKCYAWVPFQQSHFWLPDGRGQKIPYYI